MHEDIPGSLMKAARVAQWAVSLGAALTMIELLLLCSTGEVWLVLLVMFPPLVAMVCLVGPIARRQGRRFGVTTALAFAGHGLLGIVFAGGLSGGSIEIVAIVVLGIGMLLGLTFIAASPVLVAGLVLGTRTDLEAGDAMLGWAGAWLAGLEAVVLLAVHDGHVSDAVIAATVLGIIGGLVAVATFAARAVLRRRWCARVARGEIQGWRVRETTSSEELATLPPMFGSPRRVSAVLERVEMGGVLYRSGLLASPVAAVAQPLKYA